MGWGRRWWLGAVWSVLAVMAPLLSLSVGSAGGQGPVPEGLGRQPSTDLRCPNLFEVQRVAGGFLCTHGADPAPAGIDIHQPRPLVTSAAATPSGVLISDIPGAGPSAPAGAPGIGCFGDGQSGNRVQAVYAVPDDTPDRFEAVLPSIRQWAAETDAVFAASAKETGGVRHVRWVTDAQCQLDVAHVRLSRFGADSLETTTAELAAQGYARPDRKYLVWMDATVLCGIAGYYVDDTAGPTNLNNGTTPGLVARIDSGCWGLWKEGMSIEAHELMHSLGAVQPTAPHSTAFGHCRDVADRMCYDDGGLLTALLSVCPPSHDATFDCRHDDYFHTAPATGSYLTSHWNTANNTFLAANVLLPAVSIGDATVVEGNGGTATASFPVSLAFPLDQPVTVRFATADRSALAGEDYEAVAGTLTFAAGETARTITVAVTGDSTPEPDETFVVDLSNAVNGALLRGQATGGIGDDDPKGQSYWLVARDGGIFSYADARFFGSTGGLKLNQPIVAMATTPSALGYWFVASDGGVFNFGDAEFFGSAGDQRLNQPIVAMAASPSGRGYWFTSQDGGVFNFGDATFEGSASPSPQPIVAMAAHPQGGGYWLAGRDGAVYAHGRAVSHGQVGGLNQPIVGMAATPSGEGYWLVARDGGIFGFGDARFFGSTGDIKLNQPIVGMTATPKGEGYWLVARDGGIFAFGDARFWGSTGDKALNQPIVGMATSR